MDHGERAQGRAPLRSTYQDHSGFTEQDTSCEGTVATHASDRNFPVKLHFMLSELENDLMDHIVSWQPHGRCFVVHKQDEFVKSIRPRFDKEANTDL
jgi:HSF-type DNA-binding